MIQDVVQQEIDRLKDVTQFSSTMVVYTALCALRNMGEVESLRYMNAVADDWFSHSKSRLHSTADVAGESSERDPLVINHSACSTVAPVRNAKS